MTWLPPSKYKKIKINQHLWFEPSLSGIPTEYFLLCGVTIGSFWYATRGSPGGAKTDIVGSRRVAAQKKFVLHAVNILDTPSVPF